MICRGEDWIECCVNYFYSSGASVCLEGQAQAPAESRDDVSFG